MIPGVNVCLIDSIAEKGFIHTSRSCHFFATICYDIYIWTTDFAPSCQGEQKIIGKKESIDFPDASEKVMQKIYMIISQYLIFLADRLLRMWRMGLSFSGLLLQIEQWGRVPAASSCLTDRDNLKFERSLVAFKILPQEFFIYFIKSLYILHSCSI